MPKGLVYTLTDRELRDLVAFPTEAGQSGHARRADASYDGERKGVGTNFEAQVFQASYIGEDSQKYAAL